MLSANAEVCCSPDGTPFIHSLAHGVRTIYELRFNARTVRVKIEQAGDPVDAFVKLALTAELDEVEIKQLLDLAAQRAGVGVRAVAAKLKMERKRHAKQCYEEARERRLIARTDLRPMISAPPYEAPWLPQMDALNDVIRESSDKMRSASKVVASMQVRVVADMHEFVDANEEEETKE